MNSNDFFLYVESSQHQIHFFPIPKVQLQKVKLPFMITSGVSRLSLLLLLKFPFSENSCNNKDFDVIIFSIGRCTNQSWIRLLDRTLFFLKVS